MTITRIQALIIAAGLALVGVAVARAGNDSPAVERVRMLGEGSVAQNYPLRDNRLRGDLSLEPPGLPPGQPFSRL